jgi:hypothetical protein
MNRYDIEQIAYRSGLIGMDENESKKTAFWSTFELNLKRELEDEQDDLLRRRDRLDSWED